ncbi:hydroxysteroid dehydrogenase-like protein 2 isoform 1-T2 [Discoglossus pictus]
MLQNTGKLAGCTLFITGASRGIGKAIALKAARDGANVVIAAKTADPHPKLPGTIYTAAEEIEAAGGKALPCIVDVRDEAQITEAVEKAVSTFGGIDILVNNASAINLTNTLDTPMKKVDLMLGVNFRGTYLTSKICIPYLKKSKVAHILNLSPPLNLNPVWFKNHCAYTVAKYGMSMCVVGMAEEFKGEIAVNALWPKTAIYTAAMEMLGGAEVDKQCRKPDIMADAAYSIITKPKEFTGNFVIDEELLVQEGIKDLDIYSVAPGHSLIPDFFLDEVDIKVKFMGTSQSSTQEGTAQAGLQDRKEQKDLKGTRSLESTFELISKYINEDTVKHTHGIYQFVLSGSDDGQWYLDLKNDKGSVGRGSSTHADAVIHMSSDDFVKMFAGKLKPTMAFMSGKMKIKGDLSMALKLEKLMHRITSSKL